MNYADEHYLPFCLDLCALCNVFVCLENGCICQSNVCIVPLIKPFVKGKSKKMNEFEPRRVLFLYLNNTRLVDMVYSWSLSNVCKPADSYRS
jgi:hypothetical protein